MSSLFSNKQQRKADKYSKAMAKATEYGNDFARDVLSTIAPETLFESFETISNKGHGYEKESVTPIEENYRAGNILNADELILLNDVYVSVTKRLENGGDESSEQE